ncbi:3-oxo-5-alpha-steroid 4-dehydrogenase [Pichia californica]|uniref:Polyprenal reductase n=1 Tax=Pichia californica TaxID=460514 RepID=A0A9P7BCW6_9ASCO|nr:3-oxo-5-alpha-steroid 4-dehydrogenase [[Candida] californica]KAG0687422.1 3-oxo-5-alpha-steroid 4-dehydrogenase [[Candida] californica]
MYFLNQCSHPKIINIVIAFIIFLFASYDQWINHNILSNQIKYTLPNYGLFKYVICPHYFDESMIYLSLLIIKPCISFIIIFLWVLINLTISANQSYIFYKEKKEIKISNHYIIIPFIY